MTIDKNQREQALDLSQSFIVQAPAGSGKTQLLTQRYLTLLTKVKAPEEIVAITFTRKAAAEMRSRILETLQLKQSPLAQEVLKQNEKQQWGLLENPNRLRIQTIDAFCAQITKQMPLLARFGAQPGILEQPYLLYQEAARTILTGLESDVPWADELAKLLQHLDNDQRKVEELLSEMLAKRDQWLPYIVGSIQQNNLRQILEKGLQNAIIDALHSLYNSLPTELISELLTLVDFAANAIKDIKPDSHIRYCENLQFPTHYLSHLQNLTADQLEQEQQKWLGIAKLFLTNEGEWRKSLTKNEGFVATKEDALIAMKNRALSLLSALRDSIELKANLALIQVLPPTRYNTNQWEVLTALLTLLPITVAQLQILFQEQEAVDYIEVAQSALTALGSPQEPTDLALRLDYQMQHILVDEFQDTSTSQFRLLEQLTAGWQPNDGRTLFLVGDPMQSIYRFRKAEVGLFLQAWQAGIGHIPLKPLTLQVNFRSNNTIINWFNQLFQSLMPKHADIGCGAVPFSPSFPHDNQLPGEVMMHGLSKQENHEAHFIIKILTSTFEKNPQAKVGILVRARSHLLDILPMLQAHQIPYQATEIETLAQRAVIQDLLALTRALLHPADRIAWLAILRAPWCGLTLTELQQIVGEDFSVSILDRLLLLSFENLSSPARENLTRTLAVLKQSLKHRRRQSLSNWVYGTWLALGGPVALQNSKDLEDANVFFKLLTKITVANDICDVSHLEQQLTALFASSSCSTENFIDVMTIHKAKGLEFDTVILPGIERLLANDSQQLLLCMERPSGNGHTDLLLAPIKAGNEDEDRIYSFLRHEEKTRAHYETIRLLYVAITRAKNSLHIIASLDAEWFQHEKNSGIFADALAKDSSGSTQTITDKKPNKNSLLAQLWPSLSESFLSNLALAKPVADIKSINNSLKLRRPISDWQLPALASGVIPQFNQELASPNKNNYFKWTDNPARHIGTVTHQFLQQMAQQTHNKDLNDQKLHCKNLLMRLGVHEDDLEKSVNKVIQALQNTLQDERGRWILQQHAQAQSEYSLRSQTSDESIHVIIDRTFIDEDNIRWIIDYKTTEPVDQTLEEFLEYEMQEHCPQLEQYAKIMRNLDASHPIRLGLYFPLLKAWREWE